MDDNEIYSSIQILLKSTNNDLTLTNIRYKDCSYQIVNGYFIIKTKDKCPNITYTTNKVFNMNEIDSFKTETKYM